jgi:hypothetical protein
MAAIAVPSPDHLLWTRTVQTMPDLKSVTEAG